MSDFHKNGQRIRSGLFTSDSTHSGSKNKYRIKKTVTISSFFKLPLLAYYTVESIFTHLDSI